MYPLCRFRHILSDEDVPVATLEKNCFSLSMCTGTLTALLCRSMSCWRCSLYPLYPPLRWQCFLVSIQSTLLFCCPCTAGMLKFQVLYEVMNGWERKETMLLPCSDLSIFLVFYLWMTALSKILGKEFCLMLGAIVLWMFSFETVIIFSM